MPNKREWKTYTKLFRCWKKTIKKNIGAVSHHELALMLEDYLTDMIRYDEIAEYVFEKYHLDIDVHTIGKIADAAISSFVLHVTRSQIEKNKDDKIQITERYGLSWD